MAVYNSYTGIATIVILASSIPPRRNSTSALGILCHLILFFACLVYLMGLICDHVKRFY